MQLAGKVALVTGSSRGIGKAIALGFASEGANVVVASRSESEKEGLPGTIYATAQEVSALGVRALPIKCDLANEESVQATVERALAEFGHIDILVNNAAATFVGSLVETPTRMWDRVMSVNVRGTFLCCRYVLPKMIERRTGSIINISSTVAELDRLTPAGTVYAVSKAAVERLTTKLAQEVRDHNIAVNCIKPERMVSTEGMRRWVPEERWSKLIPPDTMVQAAILLAQQDARGICGIVATDHQIVARHGGLPEQS